MQFSPQRFIVKTRASMIEQGGARGTRSPWETNLRLALFRQSEDVAAKAELPACPTGTGNAAPPRPLQPVYRFAAFRRASPRDNAGPGFQLNIAQVKRCLLAHPVAADTLLRMIAGIERWISCRIAIGDIEVSSRSVSCPRSARRWVDVSGFRALSAPIRARQCRLRPKAAGPQVARQRALAARQAHGPCRLCG